ncbi:MAG: HTTM domain-containing protein [Chloroflexota bacterium]
MTPARRLALTRIVVCVALIVMSLTDNATALAWIPASMRVSMGLINRFPVGFSRSPTIWILVYILVPLALLIALVGYRTRLSLLIGASGYFVEGGLLRAHTYFYHPGLVPMQMAFLLVLTPCGDVWSMDARWHEIKPKEDAVYKWALLLAWTPLVLTYLLAGLSKLRDSGLAWFAPDNLRGNVTNDLMRPLPAPLINSTNWLTLIPDVVWSGLAVFTVVFELSYISILWSQRARWIFPINAILLHIGIWVFMGVNFPDMIILQAAVLPVEKLWSIVTKFSWRVSSSPSRSSG